MTELHDSQLVFLPYPHARSRVQHDGAMISAPVKCIECRARDCEVSDRPVGDIGLCRFGYNFVPLGEGLALNGLVVTDYPEPSKLWRKNLRRDRTNHVRTRHLLSIVDAGRRAVATTAEELEAEKAKALGEYRASEEFQRDSVDLLKPEIQQSLSQVHDYRSLVGQIVQNVNVLLDARGAGELESKLDAAPRELQAIYWSARLMESKLTAALFLMYPERIRHPGSARRFRLHGLVVKYEKIYEGAFEDRDVRVVFEGESWGEVRANPDAAGVIPHTFIDNALKYAPSGTEVTIRFDEDSYAIALEVVSQGPKIERHELPLIFDLYYRGSSAKATVREGTGFGLALANRVATELGITLSVHQEAGPAPSGAYLTTFRAVFPKD